MTTESLLFVGGPAHGQVHEIPSDARHWRTLRARSVIYTRRKVYELDAQERPDFFHVMACTDNPWEIGDALRIARETDWAGPTYIMRGAEWAKLVSPPFEEVEDN